MDFVTRGFMEMAKRETAKRAAAKRPARATVSDCQFVYPQLSEYRRVENPKNVEFPATCPVCGAAKTSERAADTVLRTGDASYACGGGYNPKPQISMRYAVYWGSCGHAPEYLS